MTTALPSFPFRRVASRLGGLLALLALLFGHVVAQAQSYTMSATPLTTCTGTLYDPGGTSNYATNLNTIMTLSPATAGSNVQVSFSSFDLGTNDYLSIYDGASTSATLLGFFSGTNNPGTITALNTSGQLTLRFYSDFSGVAAGFEAAVSCVTGVPYISSFTPASGLPGDVVTVTGNYFTGATAVKFGNTLAPTFTVDSPTQITATVPSGISNSYIRVTTPFATVSSTTVFTVPPPVVTGFSPASGLPGDAVTITGSNFTGATTVRFGNLNAASFTVNSPTQLTAIVPTGAISGVLAVGTPPGIRYSSASFVVPPPTLSTFAPGSGLAGTSVVLTGSNFTGATAVSFNGTAAAFTVNSATQLTATVPIGAVTGTLTVTTPAGTATSSSTFDTGNAALLIGTDYTLCAGTLFDSGGQTANYGSNENLTTTLTPATPGSGIRLTFTAFSTEFGADYLYIYNGSSVSAPLIGRYSYTTSPGTVTATNPTGQLTVRFTSNATYTYSGFAAAISCVADIPSITGFSPASGLVGDAVIITGTNFTGATAVKFGTVNATFTVDSPTQITATAPPNIDKNNIIYITTPATTVGSSGNFVVLSPTITSFSPGSGLPGDVLTITGTNLSGATSVSIGSGSAASFTAVSASQLTAVVPAGVTAINSISLRTPGGLAVASGYFSVPPPAISSFTPTSGGQGTSVMITGTNFSGATAVRFFGTLATFTVNSPTQITATVPAGAFSGFLTVTTGAGSANSSASYDTGNQPIVIGADATACTGSFFDTGGPAFAYGNNEDRTTTLTPATAGSAVRLTFASFVTETYFDWLTIYDGPSTSSPVIGTYSGTNSPGTVTASNLTGQLTLRFTSDYTGTKGGFSATVSCVANFPVITSFTPTGGPTGTSVVLTGQNFTGATAVTFNGTAAPGFVVNSPTQITVSVPATATIGRIRVTTPASTALSATNFLTQNILIGTNISACTGIIYDSGGANGNYADSEYLTSIVSPGNPGDMVRLTFTQFNTESGDYLFIYDGPTATAPLIGSYNLVNSPGTVTATNPTGQLFLRFGSDYIVNSTGFAASISCVAPPPSLTVTSGQSLTASGLYSNIRVQSGGLLTLTGLTTANLTVVVEDGGTLATNCQVVGGAGSFTLAAGGTLQVCAPQGLMATGAAGAIQVTGPRTFSPDANYIYNGTTAAQVTGDGLPTQVRSLTVANTNGLPLTQPLRVSQVLRLQGDLNVSGSGLLTLLSSAAGTALIHNDGGQLNGPAGMQRAITSANPLGYRHFSSPVSAAPLSVLGSPTTNLAYNTSPTPSLISPFPTVFLYDQSRVGTTVSNYAPFDQGWRCPDPADNLLVGRGYTVNLPNSALVTFATGAGRFNNAAQSAGPLARSGLDEGWHLLGNPYPSPLDWSTLTTGQTAGLTGALYVFESAGQYGGTYRVYQNGLGGASPRVEAGQGFFVQVAAPGTPGALNLSNGNRVTTFDLPASFGRGTADLRPQLALAVRGAGRQDAAYLYCEAGATPAREARFDAAKLFNSAGLNLALLAPAGAAGLVPLAVSGLPLPGTAQVRVPLALWVPQAGAYAFEVESLTNFGPASVWLRDEQTGTEQLLTTGTQLTVALPDPATDPAAGLNRFFLLLRPATALAAAPALATALAGQVQLFPNPARGGRFSLRLPPVPAAGAVVPEATATLVNALGQVVHTRRLALRPAGSTVAFELPTLPAGVYALRLSAPGLQATRTLVVE